MYSCIGKPVIYGCYILQCVETVFNCPQLQLTISDDFLKKLPHLSSHCICFLRVGGEIFIMSLMALELGEWLWKR